MRRQKAAVAMRAEYHFSGITTTKVVDPVFHMVDSR
jgi:hypothetical protein